MTRVVRFHETGGPEVLRIEQVEVPPPGKDEVRIRVHALGLNRAEAMFRGGQYLYTPRLPSRLGYEAAGTVEAIGAGVTGVKLGEAVSTVPAFSLNDYGVYGDVAYAEEGAIDLGPYANVKAWMGRIEKLPGFKKYEDVLPKQDAA